MLKQSLKLKLSQKLSPQQIQLMKLIQLPVLDFEQKLKQEIEENPALEIKDQNTNDNDDYEKQDNIDVEQYLSDDEVPDYRLKLIHLVQMKNLYPMPLVFLLPKKY